MANCSRGRPVRAVPNQAQRGSPAAEPVVHRWPHPVAGSAPAEPVDPTLHYIRCSLSYQNQLLADIKALLQQLVTAEESAERTKEG